MKLLLDTHVLLWWLDSPTGLSTQAKRAIGDRANIIYISAAVAWEIAIKRSLGKLHTPKNLEAIIDENDFVTLPVSLVHALGVEDLPNHHQDPFDRLLISQALIEGLTIVTRDPNIQRYAVPCLLA